MENVVCVVDREADVLSEVERWEKRETER